MLFANIHSTKEEYDLYLKIAERLEDLVGQENVTRLTTLMDIEACHKVGCPLDLERLLKAEPLDFIHDLAGIRRNINRDTGELKNCFVPRFARDQ